VARLVDGNKSPEELRAFVKSFAHTARLPLLNGTERLPAAAGLITALKRDSRALTIIGDGRAALWEVGGYALAEIASWPRGIAKKLQNARVFYGSIAAGNASRLNLSRICSLEIHPGSALAGGRRLHRLHPGRLRVPIEVQPENRNRRFGSAFDDLWRNLVFGLRLCRLPGNHALQAAGVDRRDCIDPDLAGACLWVLKPQSADDHPHQSGLPGKNQMA
jgi:hypothetical protein